MGAIRFSFSNESNHEYKGKSLNFELRPSSGRLAACFSFSTQLRTDVRSIVYQSSSTTSRLRESTGSITGSSGYAELMYQSVLISVISGW